MIGADAARSLEDVRPPLGALNRRVRGYLRTVGQILLGGAALALLTLVCVNLRLNLATALCLYLTLVILLSLWGSFISSAIVSVIAVAAIISRSFAETERGRPKALAAFARSSSAMRS